MELYERRDYGNWRMFAIALASLPVLKPCAKRRPGIDLSLEASKRLITGIKRFSAGPDEVTFETFSNTHTIG